MTTRFDFNRYFSLHGGALPRFEIYPDDTSPVDAPFHIRPGAEPSGTASKGDLYFDSTANALMQYTGSAWEEVGATPSANLTVTGDLTVTDDLTLNSAGAIVSIGDGANAVAITHSTNVLTLADGDKIVAPLAGFGVETGGGAATLTPAQSGGVFRFNNATGFLYTLPAAVAGLRYTFVVQTTCTSGVHRVACASGDFLLGTIMQGADGTFVIGLQDADGTTHLAWEGNGSTTGGIKGDWFEVVAISASQWLVWGFNTATGSEATPFKTS